MLLDKKSESVAAYMGVVYSGNFYVVLDAEMPASRAESILGTLFLKGLFLFLLWKSIGIFVLSVVCIL